MPEVEDAGEGVDYASNSVSFYADGKLMKQWKGGVPNKPMHLHANAWFPT
jgi:hypothetical protein